jgi:hypothetical protein
MSMTAFADNMAERIFPKVAEATYEDRLTVRAFTETAGTGGQKIKTGRTDVYTNIPCKVTQIQKFGWRKDQADRNISTQVYKVEMPTYTLAAAFIALNPATHDLLIAARGDRPAMTLRITSNGLVPLGFKYEVIAAKEN